MRDYWLTQYILAAVGWGYLALTLIAIGLALWLPRARNAKAVAALIVVGLASVVPIQGYQEYVEERALADAQRSRLAKAQALFAERCKTAGEKIYRTVDNVEGVLLLKIRQYDSNEGQMAQGAATAREVYGDDYIRSFLWWERETKGTGVRELQQTPSARPGYRYVDVVDPSIDRRFRYFLDANRNLRRSEWLGPPTRYVVTLEDIDEPSDRKFWVAGSTIKVIDRINNEVLGESIRYVLEPGQGNRAGQRVPWLFAVGCHSPASNGIHSSRLFVDQVLRPIQPEASKS